MAKARTFRSDDGLTIEVEIERKFGTGELFVVLYEGRRLVRHKDRLEALDEAARALLGR